MRIFKKIKRLFVRPTPSDELPTLFRSIENLFDREVQDHDRRQKIEEQKARERCMTNHPTNYHNRKSS